MPFRGTAVPHHGGIAPARRQTRLSSWAFMPGQRRKAAPIAGLCRLKRSPKFPSGCGLPPGRTCGTTSRAKIFRAAKIQIYPLNENRSTAALRRLERADVAAFTENDTVLILQHAFHQQERSPVSAGARARIARVTMIWQFRFLFETQKYEAFAVRGWRTITHPATRTKRPSGWPSARCSINPGSPCGDAHRCGRPSARAVEIGYQALSCVHGRQHGCDWFIATNSGRRSATRSDSHKASRAMIFCNGFSADFAQHAHFSLAQLGTRGRDRRHLRTALAQYSPRRLFAQAAHVAEAQSHAGCIGLRRSCTAIPSR